MPRLYETGLPLRQAVALVKRSRTILAVVPAVRLAAGDLPMNVLVEIAAEQAIDLIDAVRRRGHRRVDVTPLGPDGLLFGSL